MVCMPGHFKMASVLKLIMMENHATPDEVNNEKISVQVLHKQLFDADEPNLLDEEDMHIFGSRPMADPLDLVRCNTCKKPVKASQYAAHAERCSSGKVNADIPGSVNDDTGSKKPPRKGRKIKPTSNGTQKIHIKVKPKSQSENKNNVNGLEFNNGDMNKLQPLGSRAGQRSMTSVDNAAIPNAPECLFRDAPVPLATKMYHSQGNYRLRLELGQLYRESCAEQSGSHTTPNSSQENGVMASQFSPCDNSASYGAQKSLVPQTKNLDRLLGSSSESCSGIPQQLSSSWPNQLQTAKSQRANIQVSTARNEMARSRYNKMGIAYSKNSVGDTRMQQQSNGSTPVPIIKSSVE